VRAPRSRAKYDDFYDVTLLLDKAASGDPDSMPLELLRNKCIVIFRIVLISQSADLAKLQPYLFRSQNRFYVRFLDKVGRWRKHSVTGRALLFFPKYLKRVRSHHCFFAFRQTKNARAHLGPDFVAKAALKAMARRALTRPSGRHTLCEGLPPHNSWQRVCLARLFRQGAAGHLRPPWLPTTLDNIS